MFYLIKHGDPDYSLQRSPFFRGNGRYILPLSPDGISSIKYAASDKRLSGADAVISSSYSYSLQTAAILSKYLNSDLHVEIYLHEWLSDRNGLPKSDQAIIAACDEYSRYNGVYPENENNVFDWEDKESVIKRFTGVLKRYRHLDKVVVVCHGIMLHTVIPSVWAKSGEIFELPPEIEELVFNK